ncbi:hypothetical protein [uncultured Pseudomonas sp.]|uniref:hypothetical protein n=1 Tax=uncultured Pseudomonas sp. TaxID=114707 RepID=UPI0025D39CFF|nr:hypothetical protein [uncultured Pseudomonas sp.]
MHTLRLLLILLASLTGNVSFAYSSAGAEDYEKALKTAEHLQKTISIAKDLLARGDKNAIDEKTKKQLTDNAIAYRASLEASANLGFAPAQHLLAYTLKHERSKDNKKICELLDLASHQGLLASSLARTTACIGQQTDPKKMIEAQQGFVSDIASNLSKHDPYSKYYPIQAFQRPDCMDLPSLDEKASMEEIAAAPAAPKLSLAQFSAEANFFIARSEDNQKIEDALQHLNQAEELGCTSKYFINTKNTITKRIEQQKLTPKAN